MLESLTGLFDSLTESASGSPWTYALIFGLAAFDVIFPILPSETVVILAGVLAGAGELNIGLVIASAALGAFMGDNLAYWIGRKAGEPILNKLFKGDRRKRVDWARDQIDQRGGYLIIIGRFIPGGRTAVAIGAGTLHMHWPKFMIFDATAAIIWASYAALLGFVGGKTFEEEPWKGFLIAFIVAFAIAAATEGYRYLRRRRALARG